MIWLKHVYWYLLGVWEFRRTITTGAPSRPLQDSYERGRRHAQRISLR